MATFLDLARDALDMTFGLTDSLQLFEKFGLTADTVVLFKKVSQAGVGSRPGARLGWAGPGRGRGQAGLGCGRGQAGLGRGGGGLGWAVVGGGLGGGLAGLWWGADWAGLGASLHLTDLPAWCPV